MFRTLAAACLILTAAPVLAHEPLPVEYFAKLPIIGGPAQGSIKLSPDGARYAAIVSVGGKPMLASVPTNGDSDGIKMSGYGEFDPRWYEWATDRHLLISFGFPYRRYGIETVESRLAVFDTEAGTLEPLIKFREAIVGKEPERHFSQFQDNVVSKLPLKGDKIYVALDRDTQGQPGVFSFDIEGNSFGDRVVRERGGVLDWMADAKGVVRLGYGLRRSSSGYLKQEARIVFRQSEDDDFTTQATFDSRDVEGGAFDVIGFTEEPNIVLIRDVNEHGRMAIYRFDTATSEVVATVFSHETYDVAGWSFAPGTDRLTGVAYLADAPVWIHFDKLEQDDQAALGRLYPGMQAAIVSRDLSLTKAVARVESASSPPAYYYFDIVKNVYAPLGSAYPQLHGRALSETRKVAYEARDGLKIEAYLTLPKGADPKNLPLIVHPHGGPASRDTMGYDYWVQYFASRGWAVLQPNFRGSTGYGREFEDAGDGQWGKGMQNDVIDGLQWAVAEGFADPGRICIVGASYGGYVALQAAVATPELFRCAVALNGVTDIQQRIEDLRHYTSYLIAREYLRQEDAADYSPARHADKAGIPVLVAYGTKDRVVNPDHSRRMIAALKRAGKDVVEVELRDGDHGLSLENNRMAFFEAMDAFLQSHLGLGPVPSPEVPAAAK
ncbi:MAG: alpha/beta hydrolase family protein [Sphingomonadales bacterium]